MRDQILLGLIAVICVLFSLGFMVFNHSDYPEQVILGEWKEMSWVYQLRDEKEDKAITSEERYSIANHLVIHEFENWKFDNNYTITLKDKNQQKHKAKWRLKGRGHILNLLNQDQTIETYTIEELNEQKLVLHFQTDVQARGIIKITFKKIK